VGIRFYRAAASTNTVAAVTVNNHATSNDSA
jgi:hypothetical protein